MSTAEIKKMTIIELLSGSVDELTLTKVLNLLNQSVSSNKSDKLPIEVIEGIKRGKKQIADGNYTSSNDIRAQYQKQFPNAGI